MTEYELAEGYETINLWRRDGVAKIEFNRPERMNAWNSQFGGDFNAALRVCQFDDDVRAVMLTGAGRGFSSGADLKDMSARELLPNGRPDLYQALTKLYHPIIRGLRNLPKPVVSAVNGPAVGIGCSAALAGDIIVARESAYFLLAFINIGLVPDGGSSFLVPSKIGFQRAMEMSMLGERIKAPQALEWGLINRVFSDDTFETDADALVTKLASGPTKAYAAAKAQLNAWSLRGLEEQFEIEAKNQRSMGESADFVEGVLAFTQKRPASFTGS